MLARTLTGSADVDRAWGPSCGPRRALDPTRDFVVCSNVLGGCYGTTGPTSLRAGRPAVGAAFPDVSVRDIVRVQAAVFDALGVERLRLVVGGSLGGMQVLEWALLFPERVHAIVPIAIAARHSAWCDRRLGVATSGDLGRPALARRALPGRRPARAASRSRARWRCAPTGITSASRRASARAQGDGRYAVESWLHHHGAALADRFDATTYVTLTRAMDTHDVGRGRGGWREALASVNVPALVLSIDSDVLYPPVEQEQLAAALPSGRLATLRSPHGHDAFLIEAETVGALLKDFRATLLDRGSPGEREETSWVA